MKKQVHSKMVCFLLVLTLLTQNLPIQVFAALADDASLDQETPDTAVIVYEGINFSGEKCDIIEYSISRRHLQR